MTNLNGANLSGANLINADLKNALNHYYIDANFVEHRCCWDTAIVRKCEMGKGMYGKDVELICECNDNLAQEICDALNMMLINKK